MTLRRVGLRRPAWLAGAFVFVASGGCSLFFDLNTTQCEVTSDCTSLGPQFSNTICVNRVCAERDPQGTGGSNGGNMGGGRGGGTSGGGENTGGSPDGGVSGGGKGGGPGMGGMATAGSDTGGITGDGGITGEGGSGGVPPECRTNLECIEANNDEAWICRNGKCVDVVNDDCPVLLPATNTIALLAKSSPILLGGFATMNNDADYLDSQAVQNWDLALEEFTEQTFGGVPASDSDDEPRPLMAVICKSNTMDVGPAMTHLGVDLGVPAILSTLSASNLFDAYSYTTSTQYAGLGGLPVFFLSTGSADLRLANLRDDGLVWHMLGNPRVLAATATALVKRMEPFIHAQREAHFKAVSGAEDPSLVPMRVTLVTSDEPTMQDVANVLTEGDPEHEETMLSFNGFPATAPENSKSFRQVEIESSRIHSPADVSAGISELQTRPPHLVIAMATGEFAGQVIPTVENVNFWGKAGNATEKAMRPYYLASHFLYNSNELRGTAAPNFSTTTPPLERRLAGVNYAASQATRAKNLYNSYFSRLQGHYNNRGTLALAGTENYYDGAYSLIYAVVASLAVRTDLTAENIRDGLQNRVFNTMSMLVDVGPTPIPNTMGTLAVPTNKIQLYGTMGPPNFDSGSGTRISDTSAWCIQKVGSAWAYQADGLIYDPVSRLFTDPAPPAMVPACLQDYDP